MNGWGRSCVYRAEHAMVLAIALFAAAAAQPATAPRIPASLSAPSAAKELFERDWVLMNWALKFYDKDRDILLESDEADMAAQEFRRIADADQDGRVTPQEYRAARAFILARY
jgi:hypothetical protein